MRKIILPEQLAWLVETVQPNQAEAIHWRRIKRLAKSLALPVKILSGCESLGGIHRAFLSQSKRDAIEKAHEQASMAILQKLQDLLIKDQIHASSQVLTRPPFFAAAVELVKSKSTWFVTQPSQRGTLSNMCWQLIRHSPNPVYLAQKPDWNTPLNILACVDPTHENDKDAALDHCILNTAQAISQQNGANLHVLHCYPPLIFSSESSVQRRLERLHQESFEELTVPYSIDKKHAHLVAGKPSQQIERYCKSFNIDLVMMGAVSRSSVERVFVGSTVEEAISKISSDFLLVKNSPSATDH